MATCKLCNKKISFLAESYAVEGLLLCEDCYDEYKNIFYSLSDPENFKKSITEFQCAFAGKEGVEIIVKHLHDLQEKTEAKHIDTRLPQPNETAYVNGSQNSLSPQKQPNITTFSSSNSDGMFDNIADQIKTLAQVITWIGITISIIGGLVLTSTDETLIFPGLLLAALGSLSSWASSIVLYGFGRLIENTDKLIELSKNTKVE